MTSLSSPSGEAAGAGGGHTLLPLAEVVKVIRGCAVRPWPTGTQAQTDNARCDIERAVVALAKTIESATPQAPVAGGWLRAACEELAGVLNAGNSMATCVGQRFIVDENKLYAFLKAKSPPAASPSPPVGRIGWSFCYDESGDCAPKPTPPREKGNE